MGIGLIDTGFMYKKKFISSIIFFTIILLKLSVSQQLVINEFMSANNNVLQDDFGEYSDWIEIYNPSPQTFNLLNWCLSDDPDDIEKWSFPDLLIEPDSFLLVFASGKDTITALNIHTNFKIKSEGEPLILSDNLGNIIDQTEAIELVFNQSYGRLIDGGGQFEIFYSGSPGTSNSNNITLNNLTISHPAGFYVDSIVLDIVSSKPEDVIHFTFDGSCPTLESPVFNNPITLKPGYSTATNISQIPTTPLEGPWQLSQFIWKQPDDNILMADVIRYRSFSGQNPSSEIFSKSYFLDDSIFERFTFPVISVITDSLNLFDYDTGIYIPGKRYDELGWGWWPEGNYINNGKEWERYGHAELFEDNGESSISQDCGVRISGGWSAVMPQKSLRITAYKEYGNNNFNYPIFPESEYSSYKNFVLRNSGNDFIYSHFRDVFMQSLLSGLDMELLAFRPSVVYINGNYWGIHGIRERYDEHYFNRHFDLNEDSLIVVSVCGSQEIGDNQDYHDMKNFINENSLAIQSNYIYVKTKIDILNFIDYHIAEIYFGNNDWPCNNNKAWKTTQSDSKWRWLIFDLDFGYGHNINYQHNFLEDALAVNTNCDCSTFLLRKLLENEEFKQQFIDRYALHLNTTFHQDTVINKINEFATLFNSEIKFHIQRWHHPQNFTQWENEVEALIEYATYRPCFCAEHLITKFDLDEFGFDCNSSILDSSINISPFSIYPNPGNGIIYIENHDIGQFTTELKVINATGQLVTNYKFNFERY
ncbi:MAG: CotH kinase family protein, partial [Bacteroidales bacterium]|nr:CotH kinase family protein [Bacteroidales bacterium]